MLVNTHVTSGNPLFKIRFDALMNSVMRFFLDGLALVIAFCIMSFDFWIGDFTHHIFTWASSRANKRITF